MAERRKAMDSTTMIRIVCAALAVLLIGLIVMRRRKKAE
jgi:preprotein translocase subunit SecG